MVMVLFKFTLHGNFIKSRNGRDERIRRTPNPDSTPLNGVLGQGSARSHLLWNAIHQKLNLGFTFMIWECKSLICLPVPVDFQKLENCP